MTVRDVAPMVRVFKALADETRVRIIALLAHGELCVCHIESALEISQPKVSRHMAVLRLSGLVEGRRDGTWMYYKLASPADEVAERVLAEVARAFLRDSTGRRDHDRLKKSCGPKSCC